MKTMKVKTTDMLLALKKIKPVLDTTSVGGCALRFDVREGEAYITARGTNASIVVKLPAEMEEKFSFVVDSQYVMSVIPRVEDEEITFSIENGCVALKGTSLSLSLVKCPMALCPVVKKPSGVKYKRTIPDGEGFKELIRKTSHALPNDFQGEVMTSFFLEFSKEGEICVTTTDGKRISRHGGPSIQADSSFLLPGNMVKKVLPYFEGEISIIEDGTLVYVSDASTVLTLNAVYGKYYDLTSVMDSSKTSCITAEKERFKHAVEMACFIDAGKVQLDIHKDNVEVTSTCTTGSMVFSCPCESEKEECICLNGRYILDALKALKEDELCMRFGNPYSPVFLKEEGAIEAILPINQQR